MTIVDVHTHVYTPAYMQLLRERKTVPYIRTFPSDPSTERLIILPGEDDPSNPSTATGRPVTADYNDISKKIALMDTHGIDVSVISLANPWLDFITDPAEASKASEKLNDELNTMCENSSGRLFAFGALPLSAGVEVVEKEVRRISQLKYIRGVIMGTSGLGNGLDDPELDAVYKALQENQMTVFLHPHYGLPKEVYGPRMSDYGHVLPLALGFPLETTIAVARMYLSGVFERFTKLTVLIAHSGGTLPFLAGRIESCIAHDGHLASEKKGGRDIWEVLKTNVLLDAVIYSELGVKAAVEASGADRVMFGTDHPFFPPLSTEDTDAAGKWLSVESNYKAIRTAFSGDKSETVNNILGGNAVKLLRLNS